MVEHRSRSQPHLFWPRWFTTAVASCRGDLHLCSCTAAAGRDAGIHAHRAPVAGHCAEACVQPYDPYQPNARTPMCAPPLAAAFRCLMQMLADSEHAVRNCHRWKKPAGQRCRPRRHRGVVSKRAQRGWHPVRTRLALPKQNTAPSASRAALQDSRRAKAREPTTSWPSTAHP